MPTLEITTMVGCPLRCTYCPQDALRAGYGEAIRNWKYLAVDDFARVLAKLPPYVRIDFSGMAEPWANPDCTKMLALALGAGFNVSVYTTLYGMDDPDQVIALLKAHKDQVEAVVLHLPDRNGNMRGFKPSPDYAAKVERFLALKDELRFVDVMTMDRGGGVHESLNMEALAPWVGNGRAGALNLDDVGEQPIETMPAHDTPLGCSFTPFYDHNVMLPNGDVVLCCMDYSVKHRIGNLFTGDYWSLFISQGMTDLRVSNMHYGCNGSICRKCSRALRYDRKTGSNHFWELLD
jgi:organic radical activating enzyme